MSSSHSHDDDDPLDSAPATSGEALTPRGGFMARPGLKTPPRHAVVVRVGDAPEGEDIPVARSSFLPPPPASSVPPPPSASEKITRRAIPTPSSPPASAPPVASVPPVVESLPPPSDAAVVASVREADSGAAVSRRARGSRWTVVAAAAAGLLLGFASVIARMRGAEVAAQPQPVEEPPRVTLATPSSTSLPLLASPSARPNTLSAPTALPANDRASSVEPKASRPATAGTKRSIF